MKALIIGVTGALGIFRLPFGCSVHVPVMLLKKFIHCPA